MQQIEREIAYWNTERLKLTHPLRQLFWECTLRCNLSCRHCGSDCRKEAVTEDMPLEQFLPVLDDIRRHQPGVKTMVHTVGGEPLVRRDLLECGRAITERGFYWGLVTNGMLLDRAMTRALVEAGLRSMSVDIDGLRREHNWLRDNEDSYDRAYNALLFMRQEPRLTWDVITCVHRRNIGRLEEIKRMLVDAGVRRWRCFTIVPMGRAKGDEELALGDEQFRELMEFIERTRREGKIRLSYACEGYLGDYEGRVRDHYYSCRAGLTVASVLSDGGISGCLSVRSDYRQGNIFTDNFWDVWTRRFEPYRDREWMRTGVCADCEAFRWCQGNGMHLRDEEGALLRCHYKQLNNGKV